MLPAALLPAFKPWFHVSFFFSEPAAPKVAPARVMHARPRPPAVHFWWHGAPLLLPPAEAKPVNGAISTPGNPVRHVHVRSLRFGSTNGVGPLFVSLPNNFLLRNTGRHNYDTLSPIFSFNLLTDLKHWKMLSPNLIPLFPHQLYF